MGPRSLVAPGRAKSLGIIRPWKEGGGGRANPCRVKRWVNENNCRHLTGEGLIDRGWRPDPGWKRTRVPVNGLLGNMSAVDLRKLVEPRGILQLQRQNVTPIYTTKKVERIG